MITRPQSRDAMNIAGPCLGQYISASDPSLHETAIPLTAAAPIPISDGRRPIAGPSASTDDGYFSYPMLFEASFENSFEQFTPPSLHSLTLDSQGPLMESPPRVYPSSVQLQLQPQPQQQPPPTQQLELLLMEREKLLAQLAYVNTKIRPIQRQIRYREGRQRVESHISQQLGVSQPSFPSQLTSFQPIAAHQPFVSPSPPVSRFMSSSPPVSERFESSPPASQSYMPAQLSMLFQQQPHLPISQPLISPQSTPPQSTQPQLVPLSGSLSSMQAWQFQSPPTSQEVVSTTTFEGDNMEDRPSIETNRRGSQRRLTREEKSKVVEYRRNNPFSSYSDIGGRFGCSKSTVHRIVNQGDAAASL